MIKGVVIKSYGNTSDVYANGLIYKCKIRGIYRLSNNFSNPVVSGDFVRMEILEEKGYGIIEKVYDRKNYFAKKSLKEKKGHLIGSNIDQTLIIFSIKNPYTKTIFLDKCIAASIYFNIKPIILFNKIDLLNSNEKIKLDNLLSEYNEIGFRSLSISAKFGVGIKELKNSLLNNQTLILGNSGVGKSTIINRICPESNQRTDTLSLKTGRGRQTTTFSQIFNIDKSSTIIDSPGFKDFNFYSIEKEEIKFLYPEFQNKSKDCKFNNCSHTNEPNCYVKKNIGKDIWDKRYNNYLSILTEFN